MYLKKEVIWKQTKYGSMLYNVRTEEKLKLNNTGTLVFLAKFVTFHSAAQIVEIIKRKYPEADYDEISKDVESILDEIYQSGFMTEDQENRGYVNLINTRWEIEHINLELTKRCNLNCKHCMEGGSHNTEEISTKEIMNLIDELSLMKVISVVLTGGEPLLREDLAQIIHRLTDKNIRSVVFTNGTLITEEFLEEIKNDNIIIRFSLDGATEKTHDFIRGNGSFKKTIDAMRLCKEKGIDIGLSATITKINFDEYFAILDLGKQLNVKESELSEVVNRGNASDNGELLLSQPQLEQLRINNIVASYQYESFRRGMQLNKLVEVGFVGEDDPKEHCCNAGIHNCFINSLGDAYPCTLYSEFKEFSSGNIKKKKFWDIWESNEVFDKLRSFKVEHVTACIGCEAFDKCPGGCRARAYKLTGKLDGAMEEDFCTTSKNLLNRSKQYMKSQNSQSNAAV